MRNNLLIFTDFLCVKYEREGSQKKSRIRETQNLSTDAHSSTDIFVSAGLKKELIAFFLAIKQTPSS